MKTAILALIFASGLSAQISPGMYSQGTLNCRWWKSQGAYYDHKLGFVIGYWTALLSVEQTQAVRDVQPPPSTTYGEMISGITELCEAPENAAIPLGAAWTAFLAKLEGEPEANLRRMLELYRRRAVEEPKK
jgi:hypothetical protein